LTVYVANCVKNVVDCVDLHNTSMATLKTEVLLREFHYNGVRIPDPAPQMTVEQVREMLTPTFPEIATASLTGPEDTGTVLRYTFSRAIGSKG
jgi:PRTRC genetic system protein C